MRILPPHLHPPHLPPPSPSFPPSPPLSPSPSPPVPPTTPGKVYVETLSIKFTFDNDDVSNFEEQAFVDFISFELNILKERIHVVISQGSVVALVTIFPNKNNDDFPKLIDNFVSRSKDYWQREYNLFLL